MFRPGRPGQPRERSPRPRTWVFRTPLLDDRAGVAREELDVSTGTDDTRTADDAMSAAATTDDDREEVQLQRAATLREVRVGGHPTFDRVVFEFTGPRPGRNVRYVN